MDPMRGFDAIFSESNPRTNLVRLTLSILSTFAVMAAPAAFGQNITGMANAASYVSTTSVSPGEMVVYFGTGLGPAALTVAPPEGHYPTSLAGTQVLFDGIPAPILYTSSTQVSAIVPYSVAGKSETTMRIQYQNVLSNSGTTKVAPTALGLFSADASGLGPGAILNQDYTLNSGSNPASPGDVVMLFGTGDGISNVPTADGYPNGGPLHPAAAPIKATISGLPADVIYAGGAPGLVAGMMQVNVRVPPDLTTCTAQSIPVWLSAGSQFSQDGVTMRVKSTSELCDHLKTYFLSGVMSGMIPPNPSGLGGPYILTVTANGDGTYTAIFTGATSPIEILFVNGIVKDTTLVFNQIDYSSTSLIRSQETLVPIAAATLSLDLKLPMKMVETVSGSISIRTATVDFAGTPVMPILLQGTLPPATFLATLP